MKRLSGRRREKRSDGEIAGTARVDRRTKDLLQRLQPGEIAVIDHEDIDRIAAEGLVQRRPRAVINASRTSTGRYPNLGGLLLCSAHVPVIEDVGALVMQVPEGSRLSVEGEEVWRLDGGTRVLIAKGRALTLEEAEKTLDLSKQSIAVELERFAENTISYIKDERDVLLEAARLPEVVTEFAGRQVLIVVRGYRYKEDLAALSSYIREVNPLFIGVDGGADALIDFGLKPDLIIGDMDSVTTEALLSGAELVVHAYPGGHAPGLERVEALGLPSVLFEAGGTSEDIAMLLAYERGAELIVAVGSHANLVEFMDKGRKGMASTFLTRLRVGPILVDAKGVSRLYHSRIRRSDLLLFVGTAILAIAIIVSISPPLRVELRYLWENTIGDLWFALRRLLI
ncbi:MAG TPA: putative cytokinetic ring protein SteA [Actinomycetota bacterium]|nr:putative cytokinetic ring protein SteA [Actinomycetota bacterium]